MSISHKVETQAVKFDFSFLFFFILTDDRDFFKYSIDFSNACLLGHSILAEHIFQGNIVFIRVFLGLFGVNANLDVDK